MCSLCLPTLPCLIHLAPVVWKPISANPQLNRPNPRSKFILRLNPVPRSSISTIWGLNQELNLTHLARWINSLIGWKSSQTNQNGGLTNQWSVPAILLFTKNADYENEKCLKIKVFICILPSKRKKRTPFFNFDQPLWKPNKSAPFSHKKRDIFRICLRYKVNQLSWVIFVSH